MQVINGTTDVTTYFVLRDSTNHLPKTDVVVTDIDLYYVKEGQAMSAKIDVTALAGADSSHSDGKAFHVGHGLYRIDWPDIFDVGVGKKVQLIGLCDGVDTTFLEVELVPSLNDIADAFLKRDWSSITGEASRSVINALRFLRNKWVLSGTNLSVKKEDDDTEAWTAVVTTQSNAEPITGSDPS